MAGIIEVKDQGKVRIYDADNSNYVDIVVPSTVSSNRTITIPDASFTIPTTNTVYTHPNHSGEVTSSADGATVIADNVVDEANLKVSNSPTNGYMLTAQSGNTGGLTWAEAGGGDMVKLSTSSLSTASSWYSDSLDSTYYAYKIIVNIVSISNQYAKVYARLRASGSDLTASNYTWHIHGAFRYTNNSSGNGEYNDGYAGGSEWKPHGDGGLDTDTGEGVDMIIDLINPSNTVGYKGGFCSSRFLYDSARWYTTHSTFKYAAQAAYTGFKLYTTAGTMTGTVNLYGIK